MAKAYYVMNSGSKDRQGLMLMCIEGPAEFIGFAFKRLSARYDSIGITEAGEVEGTIRKYFKFHYSLRADFMSEWKAAKAAAPDMKKRIEKGNVTPNADAVQQAQFDLEKAEAALTRAIERCPNPEKESYNAKALSTMRGGVRRAHRQLVINKLEAEVLDALFTDKARTKPSPIVFARTPYKDPYGRKVSRDECRKAAEEHWGLCIKSHRLGVHIGPVNPEHAQKVIETFGSLEMYLSFMNVGDITEMRLPVIERALAQLKDIPANISKSDKLSAYEVAIAAVNEFTAWLEMANAMYHSDVLKIVQSITFMRTFRSDAYAQALMVLSAMRAKLVTPDRRAVKDVSDPFTISVCAPIEAADICPPEEAA